jgi:hypothetical protein
MKTKTHVRVGAMSLNHNETLMRDSAKGQGLRVKTKVKAGGLNLQNHNETMVRDSAKNKGLTVKTHVRAGLAGNNHNETLVADRPRKL